MANVHDVAAYILRRQGEMTAMKLQKLCYYAKAWHLVWASKPLFQEPFEAWANGPVCPPLYRAHRGQFYVDSESAGEPDRLTADEKDSINVVLDHYGAMSAYDLSALTHTERPWRDAREGITAGARSSKPITDAAMSEYYESLVGSA